MLLDFAKPVIPVHRALKEFAIILLTRFHLGSRVSIKDALAVSIYESGQCLLMCLQFCADWLLFFSARGLTFCLLPHAQVYKLASSAFAHL